MTEIHRYDVDWTDEDNPRIVIAQPGDEYAMTLAEAQQCIDEQLADRAECTTTMRQADDLRCRAADLESRVRPLSAGPRTDDERMWLEKAATLRAEADQIQANRSAEQ